MSNLTWASYAGGLAAATVVLTFLWHKILKPLAHGVSRFMELLDRLFDVLDAWPELNASVMTQQTELTALAIEMGEVRGGMSQVKTDVDNVWDRIRQLERTPRTRPINPRNAT